VKDTKPRPEQIIFDDLAHLCTSPGYVHALAYICLKDNFVGYVDTFSTKAVEKMFSWDG
jgi:hypothetical protein